MFLLCVTAKADSYTDCSMSEEDYDQLKVRLSHMAYNDRSEGDILDLSQKTPKKRRLWIKEDSPTAAEIVKQFPRFLDTPSLVWYCCNAEYMRFPNLVELVLSQLRSKLNINIDGFIVLCITQQPCCKPSEGAPQHGMTIAFIQ